MTRYESSVGTHMILHIKCHRNYRWHFVIKRCEFSSYTKNIIMKEVNTNLESLKLTFYQEYEFLKFSDSQIPFLNFPRILNFMASRIFLLKFRNEKFNYKFSSLCVIEIRPSNKYKFDFHLELEAFSKDL